MPPPDRPLARDLIAALAPTAAGVLPSFLAGTTAVQMRGDLGFGAGALGLLFGAFFGAGALGSALLGRLAERVGAGRAMRWAAWLAATVMAAIAIAGTTFVVVLVLLAVAGLGNALAQPAANLWLARSVPRSAHGLAFGVKQSAIPAAMLVGGLVVPLVAVPFGWRWAFALGALAAAAATRLVPTDEPPVPEVPTDESNEVHTGPLIVLAAGIALGAAAAGTLGSFMVSASVAAGVGESAAGLLFAAGSVLALTTRLALGRRADRQGGGQLRLVAVMMAGGAVGYVMLATETTAWVLAATPVAFAVGWGWPGLFNLSIVRHHPHAAGVATGITQTGTYIGALAGPVLFGASVEAFGYGASWLATAGVTLAAGATTWAGRRALRRSLGLVPT